MKKKSIFTGMMIFALSCNLLSKENIIEKENNYVPNEETAIKVAEAILVPIYGKEVLEKKPFTATLLNNLVWKVEGTSNPDELGGVPMVEIQKSDCKVLKVIHTK